MEEAVIGAHFAVLEEDGVQDIVTYYDHDINEIVVTVQMATSPSDENNPHWKGQPSAAPPTPPGRTSRTASPYRCQLFSTT